MFGIPRHESIGAGSDCARQDRRVAGRKQCVRSTHLRDRRFLRYARRIEQKCAPRIIECRKFTHNVALSLLNNLRRNDRKNQTGITCGNDDASCARRRIETGKESARIKKRCQTPLLRALGKFRKTNPRTQTSAKLCPSARLFECCAHRVRSARSAASWVSKSLDCTL